MTQTINNMTTNTLTELQMELPGQSFHYRGKVREVFGIGSDYLLSVATDRISAFDVILPKGIPYKGQVLNQVAAHFLKATSDIVPNWLIDVPGPNISFGHFCEPYKVEMVIRGYLTGHAWREYKSGKREICGVVMPEGMKEHQRFPEPIITPATKAEEGHDEDISADEIVRKGLMSESEYLQLADYTRKLFARGTEMAARQGLILVDTKYEFGKKNGQIYLIDEIHTPDSSRYFYADTYETNLAQDKPQRQLSKEFVREWLMEHGFQGKDGQKLPDMPDEFVQHVSRRYIELYEKVTGTSFEPSDTGDMKTRVKEQALACLKQVASR